MLSRGTFQRGRALVAQGQSEEGIAQMQQAPGDLAATHSLLAPGLSVSDEQCAVRSTKLECTTLTHGPQGASARLSIFGESCVRILCTLI
jgi:hypothetical protein